MKKFYIQILEAFSNFNIFLKWIYFSCFIGFLVGFVSVFFHFCLEYATEFRLEHPLIIWLLPIGGLIIVYAYRFTDMEDDKGTNFVLVSIRSEHRIRLRTAPLIFISTTITHLLGGSSGREGAAIQLGGSISSKIGTWINLDVKDAHIITMCGMSAAFAALFGTPITAVIFSMEVISVGLMHYSALVPCLLASIIGAEISVKCGIPATKFYVMGATAELLPNKMINVIILSILCAFLSILFCTVMKKTSSLYKKYFPNKVKRILVGSFLIIGLTYIVGTRDYNGAGMDIILKAINGDAKPFAFLIKIIFTSITLGAGFKGGEIVPSFFTGATFGCVAGKILGISPSFGASIGLISVFCGATNCPITSMILSIELFGSEGLIYYAIACGISYMLSGHYGLYSEQKIMYSKFKPIFIDSKAK